MTDQPPRPEDRFDALFARTPPKVDSLIHNALFDAVRDKTFVELTFHDHTTTSGEPHVYGVMGGAPRLLLYDDGADAQWHLINVKQIAAVKCRRDQRFTARPIPPEFDPGD